MAERAQQFISLQRTRQRALEAVAHLQRQIIKLSKLSPLGSLQLCAGADEREPGRAIGRKGDGRPEHTFEGRSTNILAGTDTRESDLLAVVVEESVRVSQEDAKFKGHIHPIRKGICSGRAVRNADFAENR
jgi:hypothetical protein